MRSDATTVSDENLWTQLRAGDERALRGLYDRFRDPLHYYLLKITQDEAAAQQVLQDLFVQLWESRGKLGAAHSVRAYLFSSARRAALRRTGRERRRDDRRRAWGREQPTLDFSPEDVVVDAERSELRRDYVAHLLNQLTERQREIVYLKYYEALSLQEIADTLGINYQSVINHLHRAVQKLRQEATSSQLTQWVYTAAWLACLLGEWV